VENAVSGNDAAPPEAYHDGVWYRRVVTVPAEWAGRPVRIVCLGANYTFDLWVNGTWIGVHEGGETPFAFDLSGRLQPGGPNLLAIRIDKPLVGDRQDTVPSWIAMDWWSYTGVTQGLYLESPPPVHVVRADVVPEGYNGRVVVRAVVVNSTDADRDVTVEFSAFRADRDAPGYLTDARPSAIVGDAVELRGDPSRAVSVPARGVRVIDVLLKIPSPARWTPAEPNLHVLRTTAAAEGLPADVHHTQFGIRNVTREDGKVRVNGRVAFFPGIARHEEWPDTGRTASWDRIRDDLTILKDDLHALFLRSGHYPNHPYTYLLTDRLGLATYTEIPVYWMFENNWEYQSVRMIHRQMFREMVFSSYNRPSILFWGFSNECPFLFIDRIVEYNNLLADDIRGNYPDGRMLTHSPAAGSAWPAMGPSLDPLDVAGWTLYYGVFYGEEITPETLAFLDDFADQYPAYPVIATEFGSWAQTPEQEAEQVPVFTETWAAFTQRAALTPDGQVNPAGNLAACSWWCAFDWWTKNGLPEFVAEPLQSMGIIEMDRATWKLAARALADGYAAYAAFGGLGPEPPDYDDDDDPPTDDDDAGDDDASDDDSGGGEDDDDDADADGDACCGA
jgi:beta-glucuronidase